MYAAIYIFVLFLIFGAKAPGARVPGQASGARTQKETTLQEIQQRVARGADPAFKNQQQGQHTNKGVTYSTRQRFHGSIVAVRFPTILSPESLEVPWGASKRSFVAQANQPYPPEGS